MRVALKNVGPVVQRIGEGLTGDQPQSVRGVIDNQRALQAAAIEQCAQRLKGDRPGGQAVVEQHSNRGCREGLKLLLEILEIDLSASGQSAKHAVPADFLHQWASSKMSAAGGFQRHNGVARFAQGGQHAQCAMHA